MSDLADLPTRVDEESPYDELKQIREKLASDRHKNIPVQGYGGKLIARYRILEWSEKRVISQRMITAAEAGDEDAGFHQYIDELIKACIGVYRRRDGKLEKLESGWIIELADRLGFTAETAREVVIGTFRNDEAVNTHHDVWRAWVRGNGDSPGALEDVDDEFLGE